MWGYSWFYASPKHSALRVVLRFGGSGWGVAGFRLHCRGTSSRGKSRFKIHAKLKKRRTRAGWVDGVRGRGLTSRVRELTKTGRKAGLADLWEIHSFLHKS